MCSKRGHYLYPITFFGSVKLLLIKIHFCTETDRKETADTPDNLSLPNRSAKKIFRYLYILFQVSAISSVIKKKTNSLNERPAEHAPEVFNMNMTKRYGIRLLKHPRVWLNKYLQLILTVWISMKWCDILRAKRKNTKSLMTLCASISGFLNLTRFFGFLVLSWQNVGTKLILHRVCEIWIIEFFSFSLYFTSTCSLMISLELLRSLKISTVKNKGVFRVQRP